MSALRELAASFGISFDDAPLKKGNAAVDAMKGKLRALGVQLTDLKLREAQFEATSKASGVSDVAAYRKLVQERAALERTKLELESASGHAQQDLEAVRKASEAQAEYKTSLLGTGAALGVVVHWLRGFADAFTAEAHAVTATAAQLRVTTQQLQEVQHAGVMAGLTLDESTAAFATFTTNARAAAYGGGDAAQAFWRLGIRTRDANHQIRSSSDALDDVAARFDRVQNPARRARLATQLFGEAGVRLIPILHAGAGGLAEWRAEVAALGGGFSPEALASARQYEQSLERFRITSDALRSQLAVGLLPMLSRLIDTVRRTGVWLHGVLAPTHGVRNALILLGATGAAVAAALGVAFAPEIGAFVLIAAAVGAIYLIFDDLITLFEGGHSVVGDFIDSLLGVGSAELIVTALRDAWAAVVGWIERAVDGTGRLLDKLGGVRSFAASVLRGAGQGGLAELVAPTPAGSRPDRAAMTALSIGAAPPTSEAEARAQEVEARRDQEIRRVQAQLMTGPRTTSVVHQDNRTVHAPITVHSNDPGAAAREAVARLQAVLGIQHDADHPQNPQEG